MTEQQILQRATELSQQIDKAVQMADNEHDLKIVAFVMMNKACQALDLVAGEQERRRHFNEFA